MPARSAFRAAGSSPATRRSAAAALREAEEEIGLDAAKVEVLGELAPYDTVTGFRIHPVVGWIEPPLAPQARSLRGRRGLRGAAPVHASIRPTSAATATAADALTRGYYVLPYQGRFIWGATAGILVNFLDACSEPEGDAAYSA